MDKKGAIYAVFVAICFGLCSSTDFGINNGGIYLSVLRDNGKAEFGFQQNHTNDQYSVAFQLVKLSELNSAKEIITSGGSVQHSFTSFTNLTYFSNAITPTRDNISTSFFTFYMDLPSTAQFQVGVTIFGGSGTVQTSSGQSISVTQGNILFDVTLKSWKFCGVADNCTTASATTTATAATTTGTTAATAATTAATYQTGEYVDMTFTFTSPAAFTQQTSNVADVSKYTIGGNSILYLTKKFVNGNTQTALPDGFPLIQTKDVTLRFPRFDSQVMYSFAVDMGTNPGLGTSGGRRHTSEMSVLALFSLLAVTVLVKIIIL